MEKKTSFFSNIEEYLITFLMAAIAIVVLLQVIFRILKQSLPWSEELSRYLLVAITFIGASLGVKRKAHVGVEAFLMMMPRNVRKIFCIINTGICIFFCAIVCFFAIQIIATQMKYNQTSPAMQISMWIAYLPIPFGMILMMIRYIQALFKGTYMVNKPDEILEGK